MAEASAEVVASDAATFPQVPEPIGWIKITLYAMRPGQAQMQVDFPDGTRTGQTDLATTRAELRQLLHGEIDRAFDAFGAR